MKRLVLILTLSLSVIPCYSQTYNLQFKSVKTYSLSGACVNSWGATVASQTITVAPSTVLKIESASVSDFYNNTNFYPQFYASLALENTVLIYFYGGTSYKGEFPVWLPAGTYTLKLYDAHNSGQSSSHILKAFVTAIEFELITP